MPLPPVEGGYGQKRQLLYTITAEEIQDILRFVGVAKVISFRYILRIAKLQYLCHNSNMSRIPAWILISFSVVMLMVSISAKPYQQPTPDGGLYFSDTNKTVKGEFLKEYLKAEKPLIVFGFPISNVINHPIRTGVQVQYFQKARMELDTTQPAGKQMSIAPLGSYLFDETKRGQSANLDISSAACRYFAKRGHYVCFAFLQFYDANQGSEFFGEPISEAVIENGMSVQYFERARMEFRADRPVGTRVGLTDLGMIFMVERPIDDLHAPEQPKSLNIRVFAANPLIGANEPQTIYVIVQNQVFQPVPKALVMIKVHMANGSDVLFRPKETNADGLTVQNNILVQGFSPNQMVSVEVEVTAPGEVKGKTTSWFRVWW